MGVKEERQAAAVALAHLAAQSPVARWRVLGAQLAFGKPSRVSDLPTRWVEVIVRDGGRGGHQRVLVGPGGKVVESEPLSFQPAFQPEEIADAKRIAVREPGVKALAKRRGVFVSVFAPHDADPKRRIIGLRFAGSQRGKPPTLLASASIDLGERRLISFDAEQRPRR